MNSERIQQIVETYGKVRNNLGKHESSFPTGNNLKSINTEGLQLNKNI